MNFEDKVCLVTGGAQGIGWAIAEKLAERGAQVHVCDISEHNLRVAAEEIERRGWGDRVHLTQCDVSERAAFEGWIDGVYRTAGRIDVFVNNAAYIRWIDVEQMTVEQALHTMRVGYDALVYSSKAVVPRMQQAGSGHFVNIGSSVGKAFIGGTSAAYAAVKAAVDGYTAVLQDELHGSPVHVMLVRPAAVRGTDFFSRHVPSNRLPRLSDFIPTTTADKLAAAVVRGIERRRRVVNFPAWLGGVFLMYAVFPRFVTALTRIGGDAQKDLSRPD